MPVMVIMPMSIMGGVAAISMGVGMVPVDIFVPAQVLEGCSPEQAGDDGAEKREEYDGVIHELRLSPSLN